MTSERLLHMYQSLSTIVHLAVLELKTFSVLFERASFIIACTVRYSSATSIPLENTRLIHIPLIEKVVYSSLSLQATNNCPKTSVESLFKRNFLRPHQRQLDPTTSKVLDRKEIFNPLSPSIVYSRKTFRTPFC